MSNKKHKQLRQLENQASLNETSLSRFCRKSISFLLYSIFIVPALIFSPWNLSSFEMPKNTVFVILGVWLMVSYLILKFEIRDWRFSKDQKIFLSMLGVLFLFKIISLLCSPVIGMSFWGSIVRHEGFTTHFFLAVWAVVVMDFIKNKKQLNKLFLAASLTAIIIALYGDFQKFGIDFPFLVWDEMAYKRIASSLGNPLFLSIYLIFTSSFTIYVLFQFKKWYWRAILSSGLILQLAAIIFTFTSSSILAIFCSLIFFAFWYFWREKRIASYGILVISAVCIILVILNLAGSLKSPLLDRVLVDFSLHNQSNLQRIYVWQSAWQAFKDKPFFGWGNENFQGGFERYANPKLIVPMEMNFDRAHNVILDRLVMEGIFTTLAYASLMIYAIYRGIKRYLIENDFLYLMLASLIVASLVFYQVAFPTMNGYIMLFFVLGMIFVNWQENDLVKVKSKIGYRAHFAGIYFLLIIIAIFFTVQFTRPWSADLLVKQSIKEANALQRARILEKAIEKWPSKEILVDLYKKQIAVVRLASEQQNYKIVNEYLDKSRQTMERLLDEYGNYYYAHLVAADFYRTLMHEPEMTQQYEIAQSLGPTRYEIYWIWGDSLLALGKTDEAVHKFQQAIDLNPDAAYPYWQMAKLYERIGDKEKANEYKEIAKTKN